MSDRDSDRSGMTESECERDERVAALLAWLSAEGVPGPVEHLVHLFAAHARLPIGDAAASVAVAINRGLITHWRNVRPHRAEDER